MTSQAAAETGRTGTLARLPMPKLRMPNLRMPSRRAFAGSTILGVGALAVAIVAGVFDGAAGGLGVPVEMWHALRQGLGGVVILVALGGLFAWGFGEAYLAALWVTAPRVPGFVAVGWLLAYLAPPAAGLPPTASLAVGLWFALLIWIATTVPFRRLALVATAQAQTYGELVVRYNQLRSRCEACSDVLTRSSAPPVAAVVGREESIRQLAIVQRMLELPEDGLPKAIVPDDTPGALAWATGVGYVSVWEALNRADEALIDVESPPAAIGEALHDMLRLSGSTIKSADHLQDALRAAVRHFDPEADRLYFYPQRRRRDDQAPATDPSVTGGGSTTTPSSERTPAPTGTLPRTTPPDSDAVAKSVIREVRHAISQYRDGRRAAILRARGRLLRTILVTGIAADVLLGLVILEQVAQPVLATAAAFFLVGGVVGLFNRLRLEADSGVSTTQDYGLFDARLLHTLLISGLAGVGGVYLLSAAPGAGAVLGSQAPTVSLPPLSEVFNPATNRLGLLVAAVFGLTPDLIIGKLRQQTDALKQDLSSSEAASQAPRKGSDGST